ncbi:MAG TPA: AbrB family transcriptional regulator, partial [Bacillota bacterium]|nr:AbrB family transcriptional regulator [Bacillota bacterium]
MFIAITILIGIIGGLTAVRLKMPAGAIIGSLFSVALFSIFTGKAEFPQSFKLVTQIGTGAYIGSRICSKDVAEIKSIIKPAIILTFLMCFFGIFAGTLLSIISDIDLTTALFATAPAGLADMTLISVDFGADSSRVAAVQFVRLVSVIAIMPNLIKYYLSKSNNAQIEDKTLEKNEEYCADHNEIFKRTLMTMAVGFA